MLVAALIAAMLMLLFSELYFPHRFVPFIRDPNGVVSHFTFMAIFVSLWLSYALTTIPGMFLLRREKVPHYVLISLLSATEAVGLFFAVAELLYPLLGRTWALEWSQPLVMVLTYVAAFELFVNMSRRKAWLVASGIVVATFLLNVWMYFGS